MNRKHLWRKKEKRMKGSWQDLSCSWASQVAVVVKNPPANAGDTRDTGLIPGSGSSPGGGHGNPLQYSCLKKAGGLQSIGSQRVEHD